MRTALVALLRLMWSDPELQPVLTAALPLVAVSRANAWGWTSPATLGLTAAHYQASSDG